MQSPFNEPVARSSAVVPKGSNMQKKINHKAEKKQPKISGPNCGSNCGQKAKAKSPRAWSDQRFQALDFMW
jgi:hypothetical protein